MIDTDPSRRAIKVWMRDVMTSKNWTASQWARLAGTSPTNITRFLSPTSDIIPSGSTISKLARVAGSQPKLGALTEVNATSAWHLPIIVPRLLSGFSPAQLWEYLMRPQSPLQTIAVDSNFNGPAFVTDVSAAGMVGRGIAPGDRIIVENVKRGEIETGHVVLFRHEDQVKVGEWQGSVIVFYPMVNSPEFKPVRSSEAEVYGRVRRVVREL